MTADRHAHKVQGIVYARSIVARRDGWAPGGIGFPANHRVLRPFWGLPKILLASRELRAAISSWSIAGMHILREDPDPGNAHSQVYEQYRALSKADGALREALVEPHQPTVERCQANMVRNDVPGQVKQAALTDECRDLHLDLERDEVGTQTPTIREPPSTNEPVIVSGPISDYFVPGVTGDAAIEDELLPTPDVLKIDVEGAEMAVLNGCDEVLDRCRLVYCETHGDDADAVRDQLLEHGFEVDVVADGEQTYLKGVKP